MTPRLSAPFSISARGRITRNGVEGRPATPEERDLYAEVNEPRGEGEGWALVGRMRQRHVEGCPDCRAWVWAWMVMVGRNGRDDDFPTVGKEPGQGGR